MYVYIYVYIYVYVCMYMYMYICMYICICIYNGIHVDTCGYMWIHAVASRGGGGAGGAIALGPGPVVGARAKLDFFCALIGSQWGIQGGDPGMITPPPNLSRY